MTRMFEREGIFTLTTAEVKIVDPIDVPERYEIESVTVPFGETIEVSLSSPPISTDCQFIPFGNAESGWGMEFEYQGRKFKFNNMGMKSDKGSSKIILTFPDPDDFETLCEYLDMVLPIEDKLKVVGYLKEDAK